MYYPIFTGTGVWASRLEQINTKEKYLLNKTFLSVG